MDIHHVATVLDAKRAGKNYVALCPICKNPKWTLNIWLGNDGKIGLRCYYSVLGQCHTTALIFYLQALGVDIDQTDITGATSKPSDTWGSLWHGAHGVLGSYVEEYLFRRAIDITTLPASYLDSLRCIDYLKHPSGARLPVMISLFRNTITNVEQGVHRTYLNPMGTDKADVMPNKMTLGISKGGVVKFGEPVNGVIAIGEGIETCLSAHILLGMNVWSVTGVGGMLELVMPDEITELLWLIDNDATGDAAYQGALERYNIPVRAVRPSEKYNDFNDELRGK